MKVEIAENMLYSWLRHCMGCQIVQTNFKVAKQWKKTKEMKELFDKFEVDKRFEDCHFGQKFKSVLDATECDLLGILFSSKNKIKIFAYESAFHEAGAHYNKKEKDSRGKVKTINYTKQKITQKIFKNYLMVRSFFPKGEVELAFVSPIVSDDILDKIKTNLDNLKSFISNYDHDTKKITIKIFANDNFKTEIFQPLSNIKKIADESELFVRAIKLCKMMTEDKPKKKPRKTK